MPVSYTPRTGLGGVKSWVPGRMISRVVLVYHLDMMNEERGVLDGNTTCSQGQESGRVKHKVGGGG